jgi:hypothetical protein
MIIIHYAPGSMGFLMLKTIFQHWPQQFSLNSNQLLSWQTHHHEVNPDLFIPGNSISSQELLQLGTLYQPLTTVLTHHIDIIPIDIIKNNFLIHVEVDDLGQATSNFLFFYKCSNFFFDYILKNNTTLDYPQALFMQLCNQTQRYKVYNSNATIKFDDLKNYTKIKQLMDLMANHFNLPVPVDIEDQYLINYRQSSIPLSDHAVYCNWFVDIFLTAMNKHAHAHDYTNVLSVDQQRQWKELTDFFYHRYIDIKNSTNK